MNNRYIFSVLALMAMATSSLHAAENEPSMFKFSGFGTLGISHSSQSNGDYVPDSTVPKGAGLNHDWATGNDSRLGLQVSADISPKVIAVLQVISEYQADNSYRPVVEWANVKYLISPDLNIRAGRIALPTFLHSDTRKVGYSYPWIHPPVELYRQLAITNSDGLDATYRYSFGDASNSLKVLYGNNTIERPTSTSTSKGIRGVFDSVEYDSTIFRIGYQERDAQSQNLSTGVTGAWVANSDLSVGVSHDPGEWFVMGEWMQRKSTSIKTAMYVSAGYRVNKFTPYWIYSQDDPASFTSSSSVPTTAAIQSANRAQSANSLGVRWDFMSNVDLKVQYDLIKLSDNSNGDLINVPAGTVLYGSRFYVLSAVVDFVF